MEINDRTIINLCKNYLFGLDIRQYLDIYKTKNISIWIDFLDLFTKYQAFPSKSIIEKSFNTMINQSMFFIQFLNNFIDYFYSLNIKKENLSKEPTFSLIKFMLKYIIINEDDTIENYSVILSNAKNIDNFYESDIDLSMNDLNNCCIDCINKNEIDPKFNIEYLFKLFDFLSKIGANKYDEIYLSIKELFFDIKSDKITLKLNNNLNDFIEQENIRNELILILQNKNLDNDKSQYSLFIEKYTNLNKDYNNKFKILYFNMLNKNKLISCIQIDSNEEIKNYNLNKILITNNNANNQSKNEIIIENNFNVNMNDNIEDKINNIMNENKNDNIKDNINDEINNNINATKEDSKNKIQSSEIDLLRENLITTTNRDYFNKQIEKYLKFIPEDSIFYKYTKDKNFDFKNDLDLSINKTYFPLIYAIFHNLLEEIRMDKTYNETFGYIVINKKDYIYTYHNESIIDESVYDSRNIKTYTYEEIQKYDNLSDLKSKSSRGSGDENRFNLTLSKGFDLENNCDYLFNTLFNLKPLPNYFFRVQKKVSIISDIDKKITFSEYNNNLFTIFMEADGAYINDTNNKIYHKNLSDHPFKLSKTFVCSKKNNKFEVISIDEDFDIDPKTIIINEAKISIPKDKEGSKDLLIKKYSKTLLDKTLLFTLNKLIRKVEYYSKFVENEFLSEKDKINNYKFLLCLFYNNIPISNIDTIIKNELKLLIDNGYIKNEFKLKCLYLIPNIGSYNLRTVQAEIKNLKEYGETRYKELEEKIKASQAFTETRIQQLINTHNKEKAKMSSDYDLLLFKYNEEKKSKFH